MYSPNGAISSPNAGFMPPNGFGKFVADAGYPYCSNLKLVIPLENSH